MSRRPRAPLPLRVLGREPSVRPPLAIDAGETTRLADPAPASAAVGLAPELASARHSLVPDVPPTPSFALTPAVDVVPVSLLGTTFALRRSELRFPPPATERATLLSGESRPIAIPALPPSIVAHPAAALVRRVRPLPLESLERSALRDCLEALYRSSGVTDANELALVGIYDRVPIGAISGAAATPHGLELRLVAGSRARRGLLVVGRRRTSGALVTTEVATEIRPK